MTSSEGMTPSEIGERAEAVVLAALTSAGKKVLMPCGGQRRYDLAYEEAGRLVKVQCKSGRERDGVILFQTHSVSCGPARDYREDVDSFGVYCHDRGEVYLVPVHDVPPRVAHLRVRAPLNHQQARIRWAGQYLLSPPQDPDDQAILTIIDIDERIPSENTPWDGETVKELQQAPVACCVPLSEATISFEEADAAATLFKALADPHRVLILNRLLACDDAVCVCEFNEELDLSQPTVSFHLKKLVNAGLLAREQRGTWAYFSIVPEAMTQLAELFKTKETVR